MASEPLPNDPEPAKPSDVKVKEKEKRRVGVSAEATAAGGGAFEKKVYPKSDEAKQRIADATASSALFASLNDAQRDDVVAAMFDKDVAAGEAVITQGDVGDNFYVVETGTYAVTLKQKGAQKVATYEAGSTFGELALMYNSPRAATVTCETAGKLWALDQGTFRAILMSANQQMMESSASFLKSIPILSPLTDEQRDAIASILEEVTYAPGAVIVRKGDVADSLFVVKSGSVSAQAEDGKEIKKMQPGEVFGESALEGVDAKRAATVVSEGKVVLLKLSRAGFTDVLGDLKDLAKNNFNDKVLSSAELFKGLSESDRSTLIEHLEEQSYPEGAKIISQGERGDAFYIIKTGTVRVSSNVDGQEKVIKDKLETGAYFGEAALIDDKPRMATVTASSACVIMKLDIATFKELFGALTEDGVLERELEKRKREAAKANKPQIKIEELQQMTILGVGTFGRVKLVKHTTTQTAYALKCMRKGQVIALKQVEHVMNEKKLLDMCDHPFLLNLAASYQDEDEIYMLLELALGGELFSRLREKVKFDEKQSVFYSACVGSAFAYMHDLKIVYRDLKPENLLFDAQGYLKVVDFGFAKQITDRTWTLCGTPEYLAPEIITNKGHNLSVDWWAFGILIYEMLMGQPPFCADDPMDIYQKILRNKVQYPASMSKNAKDLVSKLLVSNPVQRLGSLKKGHRDVTGHAFFKDIKWNKLTAREIQAPYVPDIKSDTDTSNFEEYDDEGAEDWARFNDRNPATFKGF
jgi:cGMP-dependent protein kinase